MSKYREIKTEFRNPDSLVKALADLKIEYQRGANLRANQVMLETHWSGHFGGEDRPAAIAISKDSLGKALKSRAMDGMGFSWNGTGYDLIQDQHDEARSDVVALTNQLRQRYGLHESMRLLRSKGYTVKETVSAGGQIRVTFAKR